MAAKKNIPKKKNDKDYISKDYSSSGLFIPRGSMVLAL